MKLTMQVLRFELLLCTVIALTLFLSGCEMPVDSNANSNYSSNQEDGVLSNHPFFAGSQNPDMIPNSLLFAKGQYQLFYQNTTKKPPRVSWEQAVSSDLFNWKSEKLAIDSDSIDRVQWGNILVHNGEDKGLGDEVKPNLEAVCQTTYGNEKEFRRFISVDEGKTWHPKEALKGIKNKASELHNPFMFWSEATKKWILLLAAKNEVQFYQSENRIDWIYLSSFGEKEGFHGNAFWEHPVMLSLNVDDKPNKEKWVLMVSSKSGHPTGGSGIQYFVGDFDGKKFKNTNESTKVSWLDWGANNFGTVTWEHKEQNRTIYIAGQFNSANNTRGNLVSTPRTLKLKDTFYGMKLFSNPVEEIKNIQHNKISQQTMQLPDKENAITSPIQVPTILTFDFTQKSNEGFILELSNKNNEVMTVGYDGIRKFYFTDFRIGEQSQYEVQHISPRFSTLPNMNVKLVVNAGNIECYIDNGLTLLSEITDNSSNFDQMKIWGMTGKMMLDKMEIIQMKR